jgi:hypothetical protein
LSEHGNNQFISVLIEHLCRGIKAEAIEEGRRGKMSIEEIERTLKRLTEQTAKLTESQVSSESRLVRIEDSFNESFQRVALAIEQLTQMLSSHEERLDGDDEAQVHTDSRLDTLIDSQMQLTQRVDGLAVSIGSLAVAQAKTDEQILALIAAQVKTDEQIKQLLAREG